MHIAALLSPNELKFKQKIGSNIQGVSDSGFDCLHYVSYVQKCVSGLLLWFSLTFIFYNLYETFVRQKPSGYIKITVICMCKVIKHG